MSRSFITCTIPVGHFKILILLLLGFFFFEIYFVLCDSSSQVGFMFIPAERIDSGQTQYMAATLSVQSFPGGSRMELWDFFTPPVARVDFRAIFVANCFLRTLPPVDLRAVCLVRATKKMARSELEGGMEGVR